MASMPRTQGYHLAASTGKAGTRTRGGRGSLGAKLLAWKPEVTKGLGQQRAENWDRMKRTRPLALLNRKIVDTQHNNDMYRIGGGPVTVVGKNSLGRNKRAPHIAVDRPRISFVRGADGKVVSEAKAQTLAAARPVNRPFGRTSENSPAIGIRGANGRMTANPAYADWKNAGLGYNSALSRQQLLQPRNVALKRYDLIDTNPTTKYPAPITRYYLDRGAGKNMSGDVTPKTPRAAVAAPFIGAA